MTVWSNEKFHQMAQKPATNPANHTIADTAYGNAVYDVIKEYFQDPQYRIGVEIGSGCGRKIFHLATRIKMEAFEGCPFANSHRIVSNHFVFRMDFFQADHTKFRKKYDFVIVDNLELSKEEADQYAELIPLILKEKGLVFITGTPEVVSVLSEVLGCKRNKAREEVFIGACSKEFDPIANNLVILEKGYDDFSKQVVEEEIVETEEEILDAGGGIIVDAETIRKVKKKEDLRIFFEAYGILDKFDEEKALKDLKKIVLEKL